MKVAMLLTDNREEFHRYDKPEPFFGPAPTALLEGFAQVPELELHVISCAKKMMRAPDKIADNIWYHLLLVPQWGWLRSLYFGCVSAVGSKLRQIEPDIVHGQGTERYCGLAACFTGFPSVLTIHGNMRAIARLNHARPLSYQWLAARLEGFVVPRVEGVICISSHTREQVRSTARETWLIPNAVTKMFFHQHRRRDVQLPTLLCVGTICELKNQNALISALNPLASKTGFQLLFVGEGASTDPYYKRFHELVKERSWCKHLGFLNETEIKELLGEATALVLPSLEDNCPMVILEAAVSHVPILASRVGGIPDLIEHERTGLLFDPRDPGSIASAAQRYLANPEFAEKMASNAWQRAHVKFDPSNVATQHLEVYRSLITTSYPVASLF